MECSQVRQLLSEYTDGFLPHETVHQVKAHLKNCDACKKEADALAVLHAEIRALRIENTDDFVFDIERAKAPVSVPFVRRGWVRSLCAAAACVVLFIGIFAAVEYGYPTPGEENLSLYSADATRDLSAPKPAFGQMEDAEEINEQQTEAASKTGAVAREETPEIVADEAINNAPAVKNSKTARVTVPKSKQNDAKSENVVYEKTEDAAPESGVSGGGAAASEHVPALTYTKRTVTLSVSPEALETFSYTLSGMSVTGVNGETLIDEVDLKMLLRVDGVQIVSDQTVACDTESYLGKVVLIY